MHGRGVQHGTSVLYKEDTKRWSPKVAVQISYFWPPTYPTSGLATET